MVKVEEEFGQQYFQFPMFLISWHTDLSMVFTSCEITSIIQETPLGSVALFLGQLSVVIVCPSSSTSPTTIK